MRFYFTFSIVLGFYLLGQSQDYQVISCGAGYNKQSYIKLFEGSQKQVANDAWDLAFTAFGYQDAGIFINESSGSSMGQNLPQTELYDAKVKDFQEKLAEYEKLPANTSEVIKADKEKVLQKYFNSDLEPILITKNIDIIPNTISFDKWKHQSITIKNSI